MGLRSAIGTALLALCTAASAQSKVGAWQFIELTDEVLAIVNENDNGTSLVKWCNPLTNLCYWSIWSQSRCQAGQRTPLLVSSTEVGAYSSVASCNSGEPIALGRSTIYMSALENPDAMDSQFSGASVVGIVMPLVGGEFKVMRFRAQGWASAHQTLMRAVERSQSRKRSGDTTL